MSTLIRQDFTIITSQGQAVSGASVWVCSQPANTGTLPPSPLASVYSDSAGVNLITQPLQTNGNGQCDAYMAPGVYTFVYFSDVTQELVYVDQTVINSATPAVTSVIPTGTLNGSNRTFTLPSAPTNFLQLFINGVLQLPTTNYSITAATITMVTAPASFDQIYAVYQ